MLGHSPAPFRQTSPYLHWKPHSRILKGSSLPGPLSHPCHLAVGVFRQFLASLHGLRSNILLILEASPTVPNVAFPDAISPFHRTEKEQSFPRGLFGLTQLDGIA